MFWVGISAAAATGYGRNTREIVSRLLDHHEVICVSHESDVIVWGGAKHIPLPNGKQVLTLPMTSPLVDRRTTTDIVRMYVNRYTPRYILANWDAFALGFLEDLGLPYGVYIPIDGPFTPTWRDYVKGAHKIIAYSEFGYSELLKWFPASKLTKIPHGVDTSIFSPSPKPKSQLRKAIPVTPPVPEDCFLITHVGANIGPRKNIPLLMIAFAKFARNHPDAHLLLWTNPHGTPGKSYNLPVLADMLGISHRIHFPTVNPILEGISEAQLAQIYNASDIYASLSCAEGWGYPLLESQACGVPVIAPDNSAQTEIVKGHGWLVSNIDPEDYVEVPIYIPYLTRYPQPSLRSFLECLEEAYSNPELRQEYGAKAREFALNFDWDRCIIPKWLRLLEQVEWELDIVDKIKAEL